MAKKRKKKISNFWFKSTIIVLVLAFLLFLFIKVFVEGWETVLKTIYDYGLGMTMVAIIIAIVSYIYNLWVK